MRADAEQRFELDGPLDLRQVLLGLSSGYGDPTARVERSGEVWRATWMPGGPASFQALPTKSGALLRAWGPGAPDVIERGADLLGLNDDPTALTPRHRVVHDLMRRFAGMRLTRGAAMHEVLLPTILGQRVTGKEGKLHWAALARELGEPAPGPGRLRLPPTPEAIRALPGYAFHRFGIEGKRAAALQEVSRLTTYLAELVERPPVPAFEGLCKIRGIGPWTAAITVATTHGWTDAVPLGDANLPITVAYLLAGERRADDRRMIELLEPYVGQRWRVLRLLKSSGVKPERRAPRPPLRDEFRDFDRNGNRSRRGRRGDS